MHHAPLLALCHMVHDVLNGTFHRASHDMMAMIMAWGRDVGRERRLSAKEERRARAALWIFLATTGTCTRRNAGFATTQVAVLDLAPAKLPT